MWVFNRVCLLVLLCFSFSVQAQRVTGSGAAFPSSVYTAWAFTYTKETGQQVTYTPTNAVDGLKRIASREIDFAGVQPALSSRELKQYKLVQIPVMVGAIVPVHNVPGFPPGGIRLSGEILAEIFTGTIKYWNDPKITQLNPQSKLQLPAMPIVRIVRENGAGVTDAFTRYLSAVSPSWEKSFGSGNAISWRGEPTIGKGNDGVVKALEATPGGIGYVSFDRVIKDRLNFIALKNRSGKYVVPTDEGLKTGLSLSKMFSDNDEVASLINLSGDQTWPILDATYILVDAQPSTAAKINPTLQFLYWAFLKGDDLLKGTGFVPLPTAIQARGLRYLYEVKPGDGEPIKFFR